MQITIFVGLLFCFACLKTVGPSGDVKFYLQNMIVHMQRNSINRKVIDWNAFTSKVYIAAGNAQNIDELRGAIRTALELLNDHHSFFIMADGDTLHAYADASSSAFPFFIPFFTRPDVPADIGYVHVTSVRNISDAVSAAYANDMQDTIRATDAGTLKGWIVDLRHNTGGDMWPMLAGVGPILGEGTAGYFFDSDNNASDWEYLNGSAIDFGKTIITVDHPYVLKKQNPKVAVLTDRGTASSGEAICVSFKMRNNTRSFGTLTYGVSTSNTQYDLGYNTTLILTTAIDADRTKKIYGKAIEPDVLIDDADSTVKEAIKWLRN